MNWKMKIASASLALSAVFSGSASAALVDTAGGNSSLFLTAWNGTATYTRNLGTTLDGFLTSVANTTTLFSGDSLFSSTFGSSTGLSWNIVAGDSTYASGLDAARLLVTGAYGSAPTGRRQGINTADGAIDTQVSVMNGAGCGASLSCVVLASQQGDGNASSWATSVGGGTTFNTTGVTGTTSQLGMYLLSSISGLQTAVFPASTFSANGTQSFWTLASDGAATWNVAAPAAVPVPAAVWLLGSGLMGLVGVARRKQKIDPKFAAV